MDHFNPPYELHLGDVYYFISRELGKMSIRNIDGLYWVEVGNGEFFKTFLQYKQALDFAKSIF